MRSVTVTAELAAPADVVVFATVATPHAFVHIAKGMRRYPAAERLDRPWRVGDELNGWTFLFGVLPLSRHHVRIDSIDPARRTAQSDERGGPIRAWRHCLTVTPIDDQRCSYEDQIEIDAGVLTPVVSGFARVFYRYRQRRWRSLAPLLAATWAAAKAEITSGVRPQTRRARAREVRWSGSGRLTAHEDAGASADAQSAVDEASINRRCECSPLRLVSVLSRGERQAVVDHGLRVVDHETPSNSAGSRKPPQESNDA